MTETEPTLGTLFRAREIIRQVADARGVDVGTMMTPGRKSAAISKAQAEAWSVIRKNLGWSLDRIGKLFGGRHHTTIMSGIRAHEARLEDEE